MTNRPMQPVIDVADLPTWGFGPKSPMWWGTLAFIVLEGMGFALGIGAYLALATLAPSWPLGAPPPVLLWGTLTTAVFLASAVVNHLLKRRTWEKDLRGLRIGLVAMSILGLVPLVLRYFEFRDLNVLWDANAYGSVVWLLLGLHTVHLLTDVGDTLVLAALMFTRHSKTGKRFSDVEDNCVYWDFVVLSWLPIYALIYWFPRL